MKNKTSGLAIALVTGLISLGLVIGALSMSQMAVNTPSGHFTVEVTVTQSVNTGEYAYSLTYHQDPERPNSVGAVYFDVSDEFSATVGFTHDGHVAGPYVAYDIVAFDSITVSLDHAGENTCTPVNSQHEEAGSPYYKVTFHCYNP